ncbi:Ca2+-binding RTX toxin-like protein [Rhizobium pisi]
MSQVIYFDTDAIINAIDAGTATGDPYAVLNIWLAWAQQEGAQIKITDTVVREARSSQDVLTSWMAANGIAPTDTGGIFNDQKDGGEKSILYDINKNDPSLFESQIITDTTRQMTNVDFVRNSLSQVGANAQIDAATFINDRVITSSEALTISETKLGASYPEYADLADAYRQLSGFDPTADGYNRQTFSGEADYSAIQRTLDTYSGDGPLKFGGLEPVPLDSQIASSILTTAQATVDGLAGDISALKAALGAAGEALIVADIVISGEQALNALENGDSQSAGLILSEAAGRISLGITGAMAGDALGAALGGLTGDAITAAIAAGALDGALAGLELGPLGAAIGGVLGGIGGALLGGAAGNELGAQITSILEQVLSALKSVLGGGDGEGDPSAPFGVRHPSLPNPRDPLVLDLSGSGIDLTALTNSSAYFDFTGSGFATQTGWISRNEGLLVLENGQADSAITADELLGATSGDGFADLAAMDTNAGGVVDANDASFSKLEVWIDADSDGQLDAGELRSLASLGITSFNLATAAAGQQINGNTVVSKGQFTINGVQRTIAEVDFSTSTLETRYTPPADFVFDTSALKLPQLIGYGRVPNLWVAMSRDATLLSSVKNLVVNAGTTPAADFNSSFQALVQKWAGASDIDSASRGAYIDARHLAVVYAFYGIDETAQPVYRVNPNWHSGPLWEDVYQGIISELETRFVSQVPLSQILGGGAWDAAATSWLAPFSEIAFDPKTDKINVDFIQLVRSIIKVAPADATAAATFYEQAFSVVKGLKAELYGSSDIGGVLAHEAVRYLGSSSDTISQQEEVLSRVGFVSIVDAGSTASAFVGTSANDVFILGSEGKSISGMDGNDLIKSGAGNDYLQGGGGSDTYVFNLGDGHDTIYDGGLISDIDTLAFGAGIGPAGVTVANANGTHDLVLTIVSTGDSVTLKGQLDGPYGGVDQVTFADGTVWSRADLMKHLGTSGNDVLYGSYAADTLAGGAGNDYLQGSVGSDTYVFNLGDGHDTIYDGGGSADVDTLAFGAGIGPAGVTVANANGTHDLVLTVVSTSDSVTLKGQLDGPYGGVDQVTFADGTVWSRADLMKHLGTSGNDVLYGSYAADTLAGGAGDDYLQGSVGSDTYVFNLGDGHDTIYDGGGSADVDTLAFGAGIGPAGVTVSNANGTHDLVLTVVSTSDSVTLKGQLDGPYGGVDQVTFADGTVWSRADLMKHLDDVLYGSYAADTLAGGAGDDYLQGSVGSDTYVFNLGDGHDTIYDGGGSADVDTLAFGAGIGPAGVTVANANGTHDLVLTIVSTGDSVTLKGQLDGPYGGVDQVTFADGTVWSRADLMKHLGTSGNDVLYGSYAADTLAGGAGDDYLQGSVGSDTYVFNLGDGHDTIYDGGGSADVDTLAFGAGIGPAGVTVSNANGTHDLVLTVVSTSDSVTLKGQLDGPYGGVDQVTFADGTVWSRADLMKHLGTSGNDVLYGSYAADTLAGGAGDDYLQGSVGSDTYVFNLGDGHDTIYDGGGSADVDTLAFGAGIGPAGVTVANANGTHDLVLTVVSTSDSVTLKGQLDGPYGGVDQVTFADGTVWSRADLMKHLGTSGNDVLYGSYAADTLAGGAGDDYLQGGVGSDTYVFNLGDGHDTIYDGGLISDIDTLAFGAGITTSVVTITQAANGRDLLLAVGGAGDTVTLKDQLVNTLGGVDQINFANGITWNRSAITSHIVAG